MRLVSRRLVRVDFWELGLPPLRGWPLLVHLGRARLRRVLEREVSAFERRRRFNVLQPLPLWQVRRVRGVGHVLQMRARALLGHGGRNGLRTVRVQYHVDTRRVVVHFVSWEVATRTWAVCCDLAVRSRARLAVFGALLAHLKTSLAS